MIKKCLKGLCTLGLILLPINFSSAYSMIGNNMLEAVAPDTVVVGNYTYVFNNNGNFATDNYGRFIYWHNNCAGYSCDYVYGWSNGKLYYAGFFGGTIQTQGYVDTVCVSTTGTNCTNFDNNTASSFYGSSRSITKVLIGLPDSTSLNSSSSSAYPLRLCFYDSFSSNYYCVQNNVFNTGYPASSISNLTGSLNFANINGIKDYSWGSSPFTNAPLPVPDYGISTGNKITNSDALMGFEYMGLGQEYCYGGFSLDNLFLPTEQFEDFSGYSFGNGASIFDLYSAYGGTNTIRSFAGNYKQAFVNGQLSTFHNKSKALLMFFQQIDSANNRGWGSFGVGDTLDYCSLLFNLIQNNWANDGDEYTGGNRNAINSYNNNVNNNNGGFATTGVLNMGTYTGFSTPDEFFGRLTALFQTNLKAGENNIVGVLPGYIILFMLALILFRMISH